MARNRIRVEYDGDTRDLERAAKRAESSIDRVGRAGGKLGKGLKVAGVAGAAGVGLVGVAFGKMALDGGKALAELDRLTKQTNAAIRSTGGAAGVTAKELGAYAEQIEKATGIEQENVRAGQNMLLTFTNIRNEAGKGNDVFSQATSTLVDMSTALGTDASKSAIQLGKALNDPIKGISALRKVGVTFTDDQKAQIETLVESGRTMEAQKIILRELNREFGGSAKAFGESIPGQVAKAQNSFGDLQEQIAAKLMPTFQRVLAWVNQHWPQISAVLEQVMQTAGRAFERLSAIAVEVWPRIQEAARAAIAWYQTNIVPVLQRVQEFWNEHRESILRVWVAIRTIVVTAIQNLRSAINAIMAILRGDWGRAWEEIKAMVGRTLRALATVIQNVVPVLLAAMRNLAGRAVDGLEAGLRAAPGVVGRGMQAAADKIAEYGGQLLRKGEALAGDVVDGLGRMVRDAPGVVADLAVAFVKAMPGAAADLARGMASAISSAISAINWPTPYFKMGSIGFDPPGPVPGISVPYPTGIGFRQRGGWIGGADGRGDVQPILAKRGEVFLTQRQASMVGLGRITRALALTGGALGGRAFATGGVVTGKVASALKFAMAQIGDTYSQKARLGPNSWDCSGFATTVAGMIPGFAGRRGGTTMSEYPSSSPAAGDEPVVYGFRGNPYSNSGPRPAHMGIGIKLPGKARQWIDAGSGGVQPNDSRWDTLRVPAGLQGLEAILRRENMIQVGTLVPGPARIGGGKIPPPPPRPGVKPVNPGQGTGPTTAPADSRFAEDARDAPPEPPPPIPTYIGSDAHAADMALAADRTGAYWTHHARRQGLNAVAANVFSRSRDLGVTINLNSPWPPTPEAIRYAGEVAVRGMSSQSGHTSPRVRVG